MVTAVDLLRVLGTSRVRNEEQLMWCRHFSWSKPWVLLGYRKLGCLWERREGQTLERVPHTDAHVPDAQPFVRPAGKGGWNRGAASEEAPAHGLKAVTLVPQPGSRKTRNR